MLTEIDNLIKNMGSKFEALNYAQKSVTIIFSIFVVVPILCITDLIFLFMAAILELTALKIFIFGQKYNDLTMLLPVVFLGGFGILSFVKWVSLLFS